jgi:hypothetical protein
VTTTPHFATGLIKAIERAEQSEREMEDAWNAYQKASLALDRAAENLRYTQASAKEHFQRFTDGCQDAPTWKELQRESKEVDEKRTPSQNH